MLSLPRILARPVFWLVAVTLLVLPLFASAQCVDYGGFGHLVGRETLPFSVLDLVADGDHAFASTYTHGMVVIDLSDPVHPQPLGNVILADTPEYLVRRGHIIFAAGHGYSVGVYAVDVSVPTAPVEVGYLAVAEGTQVLAVHNDLLLVQRHLADVVDIIDASDPTSMNVLSSIPMDGTALLSGGGNLFYARTRTHFEVWDLTDPSSPLPRGSIDLVDSVPVGGMALVGTSVLIARGENSYEVDIVDIGDPDAPALVGAIETRYAVAGILVDVELAYIPFNSGAVDIFNIADLAAPIFLGSMVGSSVTRAALSGHHLVCADNSAFSVFDVSGAHNAYPTVGTFDWGWGFALSAERLGDHVYVGGNLGLQVFDVSDYTTPVNTFGDPGNATMAMAGDILYVGHTNGLTVYNLDDPALPQEITTLERPWWPGLPDLEITGGLLVAGIGDSLLTFDLSDPTSPLRLGGRAFQVDMVEVDGGLAYVMSDTALHILDLADPASLPQLGQTAQPNGEDMAVAGGYAYVCNYAYGEGLLWILDVSDPAAPAFAADRNGIYIRGLSIHGDLLLATQGGWGVQLLDISNPEYPTYSGHLYHGYDTGWAYRARVLGDLVWLGHDAGVAFLPAPCAGGLSPVVQDFGVPRNQLSLVIYPNPFNPKVDIRFEVPRPSVVDVAVFDLRGRLVRQLLAEESLGTGTHTVSWQGDDHSGRPLASGIYLARVRMGGRSAIQKMSLVR